MKIRHVIFIILIILFADQALKIWVKTHMLYQDEKFMAGRWFRLYFIENAGMAYGWKLGNSEWAKMALTLFRLGAVIFGSWYLVKIIKEKYHTGFIICASLIFAGALGNLIDSLFYGMIFDKGMIYDPATDSYFGYNGLAKFSSAKGYGSFLHGHVVDMLYFPVIENKMMPNWVPFIGGKPFTFFQAIFNIADASISTGVITILLFQKRFFRHRKEQESTHTVETNTEVSDDAQVM
ncbi:MAG: lipoprotein signal peptidase [Chitinophagaceae bacterium]|nr:lipoprotein signal peptidase [Chitinophagaceae bacterium]